MAPTSTPPATAVSSAVAAAPASGDVRNKANLAKYNQYWRKDSADDTTDHQEARKDQYTDVVNAYYDGATELYEYGWGENFHFCRYYKGEAFRQALARHEHYLALTMGLKPGMRVLDVGCGVGGPAREIARFAGVEIVGINNNQFQVLRAKQKTAAAGLTEQCDFVKGDFMDLVGQFGPNSFDAVYAIEATCHAPSWEGVYGQIFRVLKPGGKFGLYEWCMTDKWDPKNPHDHEVAHGIEVGDGIPEMRTIKQAHDALVKVGFHIDHEVDLADVGDKIPWYYPLEGDLRKVQTLWDVFTCWRMTRLGTFCTQNAVWGLEKIGLAPKGTYEIGESLKTAAKYLVAGGREKTFTPMMHFTSTKPASA